MNERTILHVDANNFYASVECMLHPELRGYPIAVCGDVEERHGIVLAKNYAAKAYGVSTGEAIWQAKQKCKDLIIVPPHYDDYMKISKHFRCSNEVIHGNARSDRLRFAPSILPRLMVRFNLICLRMLKSKQKQKRLTKP